MSDEIDPNDIPSLEKGPRQPNQQAWTGTGTPRSSDQTGAASDARVEGDDVAMDPAISVGATTSSHQGEASEVPPNRSGHGASGEPLTEDDPSTDVPPASMDELLGGDPESGR